jgi:hypothetical protein
VCSTTAATTTRPYLDDGHSDCGPILPATGTVGRLKSIDGVGFAPVSIEAAK